MPKTVTCSPQTTKHYTSRKSPPMPAVPCAGRVERGNDGRMYVSSKVGAQKTYTWKLVKEAGSPKAKAKASPKPKASPKKAKSKGSKGKPKASKGKKASPKPKASKGKGKGAAIDVTLRLMAADPKHPVAAAKLDPFMRGRAYGRQTNSARYIEYATAIHPLNMALVGQPTYAAGGRLHIRLRPLAGRMTAQEVRAALLRERMGLPDTLWEGSSGGLAVMEDGAEIDFDVLKP